MWLSPDGLLVLSITRLPEGVDQRQITALHAARRPDERSAARRPGSTISISIRLQRRHIDE